MKKFFLFTAALAMGAGMFAADKTVTVTLNEDVAKAIQSSNFKSFTATFDGIEIAFDSVKCNKKNDTKLSGVAAKQFIMPQKGEGKISNVTELNGLKSLVIYEQAGNKFTVTFGGAAVTGDTVEVSDYMVKNNSGEDSAIVVKKYTYTAPNGAYGFTIQSVNTTLPKIGKIEFTYDDAVDPTADKVIVISAATDSKLTASDKCDTITLNGYQFALNNMKANASGTPAGVAGKQFITLKGAGEGEVKNLDAIAGLKQVVVYIQNGKDAVISFGENAVNTDTLQSESFDFPITTQKTKTDSVYTVQKFVIDATKGATSFSVATPATAAATTRTVIAQVEVIYNTATTGDEEIASEKKQAARKMIYKGQPIVLGKDGKWYNFIGNEVIIK